MEIELITNYQTNTLGSATWENLWPQDIQNFPPSALVPHSVQNVGLPDEAAVGAALLPEIVLLSFATPVSYSTPAPKSKSTTHPFSDNNSRIGRSPPPKP